MTVIGLLFILKSFIDSHSITDHSFGNDLQLQILAPAKIFELLHSMHSCISDVKVWATAKALRLTDNKVVLMLVASKRTTHLHCLPASIMPNSLQAVTEIFLLYIRQSFYYE